MSETQDAPKRAQPAVPQDESVTDSLGRRLVFRRMDALAELDIIEVAGKNAENRAWMWRATLAACVGEIDGTPTWPFKDMEGLRRRVRQVGAEGIAAVLGKLSEDEQALVAAVDPADVAKN